MEIWTSSLWRRSAGSALLLISALTASSCSANAPGRIETGIAKEAKQITIGGKDWKNPAPDNPSTIQSGARHFQHHCQICHGLDGQNTGVPFAARMSPPVADLASKQVQDYADGQLKWIVENGLKFSGMPGWKGILDDEEMWHIVRYMRHLPPKGSLGVPSIYKEEAEEHAGMKSDHPAHTSHPSEPAPPKSHRH